MAFSGFALAEKKRLAEAKKKAHAARTARSSGGGGSIKVGLNRSLDFLSLSLSVSFSFADPTLFVSFTDGEKSAHKN